jgi:hypothetical protein
MAPLGGDRNPGHAPVRGQQFGSASDPGADLVAHVAGGQVDKAELAAKKTEDFRMRKKLVAPLLALAALALLVAATPQGVGHGILLGRLDQGGAVDGQFMQWSQAQKTWRPAPGILVPVWVFNASITSTVPAQRILRDTTTGVLTLPSAPQPPESLMLHVGGLYQSFGPDYVLSGTVVTPVPDTTLPDGRVVSKKGEYATAEVITAVFAR